jgi:hypothetical protein
LNKLQLRLLEEKKSSQDSIQICQDYVASQFTQ